MAEWTWLHALFPMADIELMKEPIDPAEANVLVRTVRRLSSDAPAEAYEVRVAPHNVAPFRGGPWLHRFTREQLEDPGAELDAFREALHRELGRLS